MSQMPRVAAGAVQEDADPRPVLWALVDLLRRARGQVQVFADQARFASDLFSSKNFSPATGGRTVCGQTVRYLDSWLMSPRLARESFTHGAGSADLALLCGRYRNARRTGGGTLETLGEWLDAPQLAIVDVALLRDCRLPPRPPGVAGLLLDRVDNLSYWQTTLEALWGVPVLGSLPELPALRRAVADPPARLSPCDLCEALSSSLAATARIDEILALAESHDLPPAPPQTFRVSDKLAGLNVAVAYDEAMECYFPDVLDLLELHGARVHDFSPLHDESLPGEVDVVYFGCGPTDRHAARLSENHCLHVALREHVRRGGRVYAEGGGLAYLCQHVELADGKTAPMAGLLPATARRIADAGPSRAVELTLGLDLWLGLRGTRLRGYLDPTWQLVPGRALAGCAAERERRFDLVARGPVLGSRMHINFAAQPNFLRTFSSAARASAGVGRP